MVMTKRTQGRPPRNSGMNGRDRLIEATRVYLRSNRKTSLTRTEIAQGCGVTPALISYYFKDKRSLLDAVTKPLLHAYRARLIIIFASATGSRAKMMGVIRLLIEMNTDDAFLVDHMLRQENVAELDAEDRVVADAFRQSIAELVRELVQVGIWRSADTALTDVALWGLCRAYGEALRVRPETGAATADTSDDLVARTAFVFALFETPASDAPDPGHRAP